MKFKKQKLSKEQIKNRNSAYKEIINILAKYPRNTPVLFIRGHIIDLKDNIISCNEITHFEISDCIVLNSESSFEL